MRISKISIKNFANFSDFQVYTGDSLVIVGENKVGKSNLIFALQLVLDPSLSERDRMLTLDHFWDGLGDEKMGATVEISVDLTDYDRDPSLIAHLGDCIISPGPPMVSRVTYRFQPKGDLEGEPASLADYEYIIFGGSDPDNSVSSTLRRMLPLDVLGALRDAEKDLATWHRSPLRPLIKSMAENMGETERKKIESEIDVAQAQLIAHNGVQSTAQTISRRLIEIVGGQHASSLSLGLSPVKADTLLQALRILIDNGSRGIDEASLGTSNLIFLTLKSLEFDRLAEDGARNHTFLAVEEPEAHLHPHVQRLVYKYFLEADSSRRRREASPSRLTTILTTHSPHIASVAPLRSLVLLRHDAETSSTWGASTAQAPLTADEEADLQRYVDVTRGELFFARGVVLVEGEAERFLVPAFAEALGIHLDVLGISVCSVAGTNFAPYVKLLGSGGLNIPYVILTDRDLVAGSLPRSVGRIQRLLGIVDPAHTYEELDERSTFIYGTQRGFFVNDDTLEIDLFKSGLSEDMQTIILEELPRLVQTTKDALEGWVEDPDTLDKERLLKLIDRVSKGRFAQRLASLVDTASCPAYIREALEKIRDEVS